MSKQNNRPKHRLKPLSLYPLKAEEALSLFMQVDPAKVRVGLRKLRQGRGGRCALPKA
jgi:hypothetical protein